MQKTRIISACLFGAAFLFTVNFMPAVGNLAVGILLAGLCLMEFYSLMDRAQIPVFRVVGLVFGTALLVATYLTAGVPGARPWDQVVLLLGMIAVLIRQFPQKHNDKPLQTIACTLLGVWYVPFLFQFLNRLGFGWDPAVWNRPFGATGRLLILYMVIVVKLTDTGAYIVGMLFGRHKFFARISPKKTWEGFFGGLAMAMAASVIFCWVTGGHLGKVPLGYGHAVALGLTLGVAGVVGDLFESLLKRAAGVKDSGILIPGMGGVLDVIDSLLFGAPVMYAYVCVFLT